MARKFSDSSLSQDNYNPDEAVDDIVMDTFGKK